MHVIMHQVIGLELELCRCIRGSSAAITPLCTQDLSIQRQFQSLRARNPLGNIPHPAVTHFHSVLGTKWLKIITFHFFSKLHWHHHLPVAPEQSYEPSSWTRRWRELCGQTWVTIAPFAFLSYYATNDSQPWEHPSPSLFIHLTNCPRNETLLGHLLCYMIRSNGTVLAHHVFSTSADLNSSASLAA